MKLVVAMLAVMLVIPVVSADDPPAARVDASPPEPEQAKQADSIPLAPVEVRGKRNLFDEQAAKRKKLLDDSGPCLGCDAKPIEHHPKLLERLANSAINQVTPQAAPEKDEARGVEQEVMTESRHPSNSTP